MNRSTSNPSITAEPHKVLPTPSKHGDLRWRLSARLAAGGGAFRRVTTRGDYIPEIDGFRFVAIVSVVLFHLLAQLNRYYDIWIPSSINNIIGNGDRGVRLFFVISGFVLALPFARSHMDGTTPVSLRRYFIRRLSRLEPPYILAVLLLAVLLRVTHTPVQNMVAHTVASIAYCHNIVFGQPSSIIGVAWSLEVEVQFYVLVPLLTSVFRVRRVYLRRSILAGIIVVLGLVHTVAPTFQNPSVRISLAYYLQFFLAGFLLVDLFLSRKKPVRLWAWDLVSVLGWPVVFLLPAGAIQIVLPLLIVALYWAAFNGRVFNWFFRIPLITSVGGMCYTIYLLHYPIIAAATRIVGHSRPISMLLLSLVMIICFSAIYFLAVEKPCMNPQWPYLLLAKVRRKQGPRDIPTLVSNS